MNQPDLGKIVAIESQFFPNQPQASTHMRGTLPKGHSWKTIPDVARYIINIFFPLYPTVKLIDDAISLENKDGVSLELQGLSLNYINDFIDGPGRTHLDH